MKKIKFFIIIFFMLLFVRNSLFALDTLSIRYFPLHIGNFWVYQGNEWSFGGGSYYWVEKFTAVFSRSVNNHLYYYLNSSNSSLFNGYYRVDSITGSVYRYDSTGSCPNYLNEKLIDSLAAINGDTVRNCGSGSYICLGTSSYAIFGDTTIRKTYEYSWSNPYAGGGYSKSYIRRYGFRNYSNQGYGGGGFGGYSLTLKGCKINGVVYGDTSLTNVYELNYNIPGSFNLSQNYPNPFNPVTKIRFEIPSNGFPTKTFGNDRVVLIVYDLLGKEITTLVNEKLQPGTYEVTFDGSNLPSGIYFYQLRTEDYIESKKMVLIK